MAATVSAGLCSGKSISMMELKPWNKKKGWTIHSTTDLGGESRDFVESSSNTSFAFGLALLLILAAQFESFIDPFIIMTVPMAVAGALFSLCCLTRLGIYSARLEP
jgi:HAE1 family hydrophobic/amphiphilic exporter-1/multidrug efflux pump